MKNQKSIKQKFLKTNLKMFDKLLNINNLIYDNFQINKSKFINFISLKKFIKL